MLLPDQPRIQDYLTDKGWFKVTPKKKGFKQTRKFPSPCKSYDLSLVGVNRETDLAAPSPLGVNGPLHKPRHRGQKYVETFFYRARV
jgi:hypothetical protein